MNGRPATLQEFPSQVHHRIYLERAFLVPLEDVYKRQEEAWAQCRETVRNYYSCFPLLLQMAGLLLKRRNLTLRMQMCIRDSHSGGIRLGQSGVEPIGGPLCLLQAAYGGLNQLLISGLQVLQLGGIRCV